MNYITQLNGFFAYLDRERSLTPNCVSLYLTLLHVNNRKNWERSFTVKNKAIEDLIGLSRVKFIETRKKLIQKGLINYTKSSGSSAGNYSLFEFGKTGTQMSTQTGTQSDTQNDTQTGTQNDSPTLYYNKQKQYKQNKQNNNYNSRDNFRKSNKTFSELIEERNGIL